MAKVRLNERLEEEVFDRLMRLKASQRIALSDLLANAMDALEREWNLPQTVTEQVEELTGKFMLLTDLLAGIDQKLDKASSNEMSRLKSLLDLLKQELERHDQAEKERFQQLRPTPS